MKNYFTRKVLTKQNGAKYVNSTHLPMVSTLQSILLIKNTLTFNLKTWTEIKLAVPALHRPGLVVQVLCQDKIQNFPLYSSHLAHTYLMGRGGVRTGSLGSCEPVDFKNLF